MEKARALLSAATDVPEGAALRLLRRIPALDLPDTPAADKILTSAAFISLLELDLAPAWMVVVIVAREFAVSTLP